MDITMNFERHDGSSSQIVVQKEVLDGISYIIPTQFQTSRRGFFMFVCAKERLRPHVINVYCQNYCYNTVKFRNEAFLLEINPSINKLSLWYRVDAKIPLFCYEADLSNVSPWA